MNSKKSCWQTKNFMIEKLPEVNFQNIEKWKSQALILYTKLHKNTLNKYTKTCIKIHAWQGEIFMIEKLP